MKKEILNRPEVAAKIKEILDNAVNRNAEEKSAEQIFEEFKNDRKALGLTKKEKKVVVKYIEEQLKEIKVEKESNPEMNEEEKRHAFYQKMILAFSKLDYDHLNDRQKEDILFQIKRGEFFDETMKEELNLTDEEMKIIIATILEKFGYDVNYEIVVSNPGELVLSEKKENISKEEKEIIEKILENKDAAMFTKNLIANAKNTKLEDFERVEDELNTYKKNKETFGLTIQEKETLVNYLEECLRKIKEEKEIKRNIKESLNIWCDKVDEIPAPELMAFYKKVENAQKEDFQCENMSEKEWSIFKKKLQEYIMDSLAMEILEDLGLYNPNNKVEDIEKELGNIDYQHYHVEEEMLPKVKECISKKMEEEKAYRHKNNQEVKECFNIDEKVVLTNDIMQMESEEEFLNQTGKKKIKKGKSGKIIGYFIQKDNDYNIVGSKEELENALNDGYQLTGYDVDFGNPLKSKYSYVKKEDLAKKEKKTIKDVAKDIKKHAKAIMVCGVVALVAALGLKGCSNYVAKHKQQNEEELDKNNKPSNTTITITNPKEETKTVDDEILEILEQMPDQNSTFTIKEDASIYKSADTIGVKPYTPYYKAGTEKQADAIFLKSPEGEIKGFTDTEEIVKALEAGYEYIGVRATNEHSYQNNKFVAYEGFFKEDDLVVNQEQTRARTLKK